MACWGLSVKMTSFSGKNPYMPKPVRAQAPKARMVTSDVGKKRASFIVVINTLKRACKIRQKIKTTPQLSTGRKGKGFRTMTLGHGAFLPQHFVRGRNLSRYGTRFSSRAEILLSDVLSLDEVSCTTPVTCVNHDASFLYIRCITITTILVSSFPCSVRSVIT